MNATIRRSAGPGSFQINSDILATLAVSNARILMNLVSRSRWAFSPEREKELPACPFDNVRNDQSVEAFMKTNNMSCAAPRIEVPQSLVTDFASDPLSQYEKVLKKINDSSWPLHSELAGFLRSLDSETIQSAYADSAFVGLYGKNEQLARAWIAQRLLDDQVGRTRLETLSQTSLSAEMLPYSADCLRGVKVDDEAMVRLAD